LPRQWVTYAYHLKLNNGNVFQPTCREGATGNQVAAVSADDVSIHTPSVR